MSSLKKISHLFLTGRPPALAARFYEPAGASRPLHTLLIADPSGRGLDAEFGIGLAQALSAHISTVLLLNAGHALTNSPLLARYLPPENGCGFGRAQVLVESFRQGEQFGAAYPALTRINLLLITDAQAEGRDWPAGYLHITDTLIVLIGPDSDPEQIGAFAASAVGQNPAIGLCLCGTDSPGAGGSLQDVMDRVIRQPYGAGMTLLGRAPAVCAPRQIVMGDRIVTLGRPEHVQARQRAYQFLADRLLKSRPPADARLHAGDVLHALHNVLAGTSSHPVMYSTPAAPCTKHSIP